MLLWVRSLRRKSIGLITSARGGMMQISGGARGRTPVVAVRLFEAV
jgi:hypothetical protein